MRFVLLLAIGVVMTACGSLTAPGGTESGFAMNGDVRLRWFLDLPLGNGPFPAVVYGPGSGHITADNGSTIRFARELNDLGFVVMRYDKRGTGGSAGSSSSTAPISEASWAMIVSLLAVLRSGTSPSDPPVPRLS